MRRPWKLCFEQSMLSIKCIFAYYQTYFCFLSNVNMIAVKYNLIQRLLCDNYNPHEISMEPRVDSMEMSWENIHFY